jgi:hypothetical protein
LGSAGFLSIGDGVDRIDVRSGRSIWGATPRCKKQDDGRPGEPSYVQIIGGMAYVGCRGGELLAVRASDGRTLATALPAFVDNYDQVISLGKNALGVGGSASGAYMYRQSAILRPRTLARVAVFLPNMRILGSHDGNAVVDDDGAGSQGRHTDSSPGTIDFVSLRTGEAVDFAILHPYAQPLPSDRDDPLSETAFQIGDALYVPTHTALFAYNLDHLNRQPKILYDDLADVPVPPDGRYLTIKEGTPGHVRKTSILDAGADMRSIWSENDNAGFTSHQTQTDTLRIPQNGRTYAIVVDRGCRLAAKSASDAFMGCNGAGVPSNAHLGAPATPLVVGRNTLTPQTIAIYKLQNH